MFAKMVEEGMNSFSIKDALLNLSQIYAADNWPADKSKITKNLADLIYNPKSRKSMLFHTLARGISKLEDTGAKSTYEKLKPKDQDCVDKLSEAIVTCRGRALSGNETSDLIFLIPAIKEQHDRLHGVRSVPGGIWWHNGLAKEYSKFLKVCYNGFMNLTPQMIRPDGNIWNKFLTHLADTFGGIDVYHNYNIGRR